MIYTRFKREKFGKCNICLNESALTLDHVPPKGSIEITPVEQENIFHRLTQKERKFSVSRNGIKFRTICSVCNNVKLGAELDPVLNDFTRLVSLYLKSDLILPTYIEIETRPNALIRAIIGHLLAAKIDIDDSDFENLMRGFVFDYSSKIPDEINIFFWIFPFENTIIMRDFAMPSVRNRFKDIGVFNVLKFFPVAYLITSVSEYEGLPCLTDYRNLHFNETAKITVNLKNYKNQNWPENIDRGNFIIGGASFNSSVFASPRKSKTKN